MSFDTFESMIEYLNNINNTDVQEKKEHTLNKKDIQETSKTKSVNTVSTNTIKTMASCNKTLANVGEILTLSSTPSGGTPNYTVEFSKDGTTLNTFNNVAEGQTVTYQYTVPIIDAGKTVTFSVTVTDSCPGNTPATDSCTVNIQQCSTPVCNFSVS